MTVRILCLLALFGIVFVGAAQKPRRHALIIGIDKYRPEDKQLAASGRGFGDLDGAVNDALAFQMLLKARYGFRTADMQILLNGEATAERILKELQAVLQRAKAGDQVIIYYAGHGSQVSNPLSPEPDKMDETIVPADAWRGNLDGKLYDIRDKEIARMVYPAAQAGVQVTVIFDSCHSGSVTRAAGGSVGKIRKAAPSGVVLEDASESPPLEAAGVLVLTAAQDFQPAQEYYDAKGNPHGAFTYALMQAMRESGRRESVRELFLRTRARLKALGLKQEPVLLGNEQRRRQPLIAPQATEGTDEESPILVTVAAKTDKGIVIEGGPVLGIYENTLLKPFGKQPLSLSAEPRLRVKQLLGGNRALCELEQGDARRIQIGDAWEAVSRTVPERSRLRLCLPLIARDAEQLAKEAADFSRRAALYNIQFSESSQAPFAVLYRNQTWQLQDAAGNVLAQEAALDRLTLEGAAGSAVYWLLPLPQTAAEKLQKDVNQHVIRFADEQTADYVLGGFYHNGELRYGWLRQAAGADTSPMPKTSALIGLQEANFNKTLGDYLVQLARIKNLLTIENPPEDHPFPYRLVLVNAQTGQIHRSDTLRTGQTFGLRLQLDTVAAASWSGRRSWVYVFVLDSEGNTSLLYPRSGNVENFLPAADEHPESIALGSERLLRITPPFGADTYITLLTHEPLPDPFLLQQKGVQTRAAEHPLSDLLLGSSETRSASLTGSWQIRRQVFVSMGQ